MVLNNVIGFMSKYPNMNANECNDDNHNDLINYLRKTKPYFFSVI